MAFVYDQTPTDNPEMIAIGADVLKRHVQGLAQLSNYLIRYRRKTLLSQNLEVGHEFKAQAQNPTYVTVFTASAKTSPNPSDLSTTLSVGVIIKAKRLGSANGDIQITVDGQVANFTVDTGSTDDVYQTTTVTGVTHDATIAITAGISSDTSGQAIRLQKICIYEKDLSA